MKRIKVKTPAKINLTLEVLNKREDNFHNIQSIMQAINLYDYLTFELEEKSPLNNDSYSNNEIILKGNSNKIPYDKSNLIYKAIIKFFEKTKIQNLKITVNIEKNIPVAAGLAGGSSNASGTIFALNKLFNNPLNEKEINEICSSLGSDLNFCLYGGCMLCTSRGEILEKLPFFKQNVSLIKPKSLGISAKEAYLSFENLKDKSNPNNTTKLKNLLLKGDFDKNLIYNSFEKALFPKYKELTTIKENVKNSLMSGSGSTFFVLENQITTNLDKTQYDIFENLETINTGVEEIYE
jgi:4-diphosphocytidyl-2-C-methyl-D-erythritol kinase